MRELKDYLISFAIVLYFPRIPPFLNVSCFSVDLEVILDFVDKVCYTKIDVSH